MDLPLGGDFINMFIGYSVVYCKSPRPIRFLDEPYVSEETEDPGAKVSSEWLLMNNKHRQSVEQRHRTGTNTK